MKKIISVLLIICCALTFGALAACSSGSKDISVYDISVRYDEKSESLTGTESFEFYNCYDNELGELKFNLYGNAFRREAKYSPVSDSFKSRAYYAGESYGGMEITGVENCASWEISGEDENILSVTLAEPVYPAQRTTVEISFTLSLAKINHRTGVTPDSVNLGNFYPILCAYTAEGFVECPYYACGDPFMSECANYSVNLDIPETYTAAASGKAQSESIVNGRRKTQYVLTEARDFAIVLSDKFEVVAEEVDGVEVSYYYIDDSDPSASLKAAVKSLEYFNQTFGKYIYPTLSVVQTGFVYGGMEYPALTMIASGQQSSDNIYTIVHENAHQWWYAMVGSDQLTCAWQDEGLAEYSTLMFFENNPDYGYTRTAIVEGATRAYRAFFSVYSQLNDEVDTTMTRNLGSFSGEYEYTNIAYNKPLIMFDILRKSMGDDKFTACLETYFEKYCKKIASSEALIACFASGGADVEGLFSSFIEGKILI